MLKRWGSFFRFPDFPHIRMRRVAAYCLRFIHNCRKPKNGRLIGSLAWHELNNALHTLIKLSQKECFSREIEDLEKSSNISSKSSLLCLAPFLDHGILRVGGRLAQSSFSYGKKHPILLSSKHYFTKYFLKGASRIISLWSSDASDYNS